MNKKTQQECEDFCGKKELYNHTDSIYCIDFASSIVFLCISLPYGSACGSLMYAMVATRLDTAHAMQVVNWFMSNPRKKYWEAIKLILRYLSGTIDWQLCYGQGDLSIQGYVDSDYAG